MSTPLPMSPMIINIEDHPRLKITGYVMCVIMAICLCLGVMLFYKNDASKENNDKLRKIVAFIGLICSVVLFSISFAIRSKYDIPSDEKPAMKGPNWIKTKSSVQNVKGPNGTITNNVCVDSTGNQLPHNDPRCWSCPPDYTLYNFSQYTNSAGEYDVSATCRKSQNVVVNDQTTNNKCFIGFVVTGSIMAFLFIGLFALRR